MCTGWGKLGEELGGLGEELGGLGEELGGLGVLCVERERRVCVLSVWGGAFQEGISSSPPLPVEYVCVGGLSGGNLPPPPSLSLLLS